MIPYLDTSLVGFLSVTVFLGCGASWLMGQAVAATWRPLWQLVLYAAMLGLADRFMNYGLFQGEPLSTSGYLLDTALILIAALVAYRITRARIMVRQYPWLYARSGPFGWREIGEAPGDSDSES